MEEIKIEKLFYLRLMETKNIIKDKNKLIKEIKKLEKNLKMSEENNDIEEYLFAREYMGFFKSVLENYEKYLQIINGEATIIN